MQSNTTPPQKKHLRDHQPSIDHSGFDPPRTLSQVLLPQLSKPSLCFISAALLLLIHGIDMLESLSSSRGGAGGSSDDSRGDALVANRSSFDDRDGLESARFSHAHMTTLLLQQLTRQLLVPKLLLLLLLVTTLLVLQYTRLSKIIATTSPVPGVTPVPGAHPYMGHYSQLLHPATEHHFVFRQFATPSGISAFWGPGLKGCASVLLASHARLILRHNSQRDFSDWIVRHGRRTLGEDSLILIAGGQRWKNVRKVVARAFTNRIVRDGRRVVGRCAAELVDWLERACDRAGGESCCNGHGANGEGRGAVCLEAEDFFKSFSQCVPKSDGGSDDDNRSQTRPQQRSSCRATCSCLTVPPEAKAFEFLGADIGTRASPSSFVNPAMQFYWIPTRYNRTYRANMELVNGLMGRIIGRELDRKLRSIETSSSDGDTDVSTDDELEQEEERMENMVTHLTQSCMEQHFSQSSASSQPPSGCPFATSSISDSLSSSSSGGESSIPPPSQITLADKQKIIQDVSKILHTLLVAGYETTAISLSYVMYCLSKNPRCQDRCHEEARRVLGNKRKDGALQPEPHEEAIDDDDLTYCRAVLTESLRMHLPVLFTTRVLSKDLTLDTGYTDEDKRFCTLSMGTRVFINPAMIHLDERNYERPHEFVPERWVRWDDAKGRWTDRDYESGESSAETNRSRNTSSTATRTPPPPISEEYEAEHAHAESVSAANPANFFAFSDGARNCVGRRLALMESTLLIATLLRDMCVGFAEGKDFKLVKERRFVTVKPASLPLVFWKR